MLEVIIQKTLDHFLLDCTFKLDREVLALQGESGAGKTTVLNCLSGLVTPDKGRIRLNDKILYDGADGTFVPARFRNVGCVFQNYALFPHMTVLQNVTFGQKNPDRQAAWNLLESFGLNHLADVRPTCISGGEKQRVALARALAGDPDLLLMDEPFSALDADTREKLYREFFQFRSQWSGPVVMVTHNPLEAEFLADKVLKIEEGTVIRERYNHLEGTVLEYRRHEHYLELTVRCADAVLNIVKPDYFSMENIRAGSPILLTIKPEHLLLYRGNGPYWTSADNRIPARVLKIDRTRRSGKILLEVGGNRLVGAVPLDILAAMPLAPGDDITCIVNGQDIEVLKI